MKEIFRTKGIYIAGPESLIELLVEHGADINAINGGNDTPLIFAIESGKSFGNLQYKISYMKKNQIFFVRIRKSCRATHSKRCRYKCCKQSW